MTAQRNFRPTPKLSLPAHSSMTRCSRNVMDRLIYTALSGASQTLYDSKLAPTTWRTSTPTVFAPICDGDQQQGERRRLRHALYGAEGASGVNDSTGVAEKTERPLTWRFRGQVTLRCRIKTATKLYPQRQHSAGRPGATDYRRQLVLGDNGPIILPPNAIASFGATARCR